MNRRTWVLLTLVAAQGCGTSSPPPAVTEPPPASSPEAAAAPPTSTAAPVAADPPAPSAAPGPVVDEDAPPKPPPVSTTRKAALRDQVKGTPLVVLHVTDAAGASCDAKPAEGASMLEATVYWKPGFYEIGTKTKTAAVKARQLAGGKWKSLPDAFTGDVQVREAPVEPGKIGRVHVRAQRAGETIDEELEVVVCVAVEPPKAKGK